MFAFVVLQLVSFSNEPRDWPTRTSPKWSILCWVRRKTLTQPTSGNKLIEGQLPLCSRSFLLKRLT